jgi:hypothetical protein
VTLQTRGLPPGVDGPAVTENRLEASSAAYPVVEAFYPLRYRIRSWSDAASGALLGFEFRQDGGKSRHAVYRIASGPPGAAVQRLDPGEPVGRAWLDDLEVGEFARGSSPAGLVDRLGLLQQVRRLDLADGRRFGFDVTSGSQRYRYTVRVERQTSLNMGGATLAAWKLRFDAERVADDGATEIAHRPIYVWLSQGPERVPLRVDVRHPIGRFRVELVDPAGLAQRVAATP